MDMVIVGSIGYDDIQTPEASGSGLLGGAAVYSGLAASFHLRTMNEEPTKVGLVGVVGDDFAIYDQMILENAGLNFCLLYTSPSPRDMRRTRMPSSA